MVYLILSIISSVLVAVVIRINEQHGLNRLGVMLVNYLLAALMGLLLTGLKTEFADIPRLLPFSMATAIIFVTAFVVYMAAIRKDGLAIPVTVTRLSVVIPVLGSILLFSESIGWLQGAGLLFGLLAIFLFSWDPAGARKIHGRSDTALLLLLFILMGSGDTSLKIFQEVFKGHHILTFMTHVFFLSALFTLILILIKKIRLNKQILIGGILLGIPNFFSAYFILKVLQVLPGALAFPLNNIGIILLSTLAGIIFWREKLNRQTTLAIGLAIIAVYFLTRF